MRWLRGRKKKDKKKQTLPQHSVTKKRNKARQAKKSRRQNRKKQ